MVTQKEFGITEDPCAKFLKIRLFSCTSFQRPKWPQTKMHTISNTISRHSFKRFFTWHDTFSVSLGNFLIGWNSWTANQKLLNSSKVFPLNKMDHTIWKSMKACVRKWCGKLCPFFVCGHFSLCERCAYSSISKRSNVRCLERLIFGHSMIHYCWPQSLGRKLYWNDQLWV